MMSLQTANSKTQDKRIQACASLRCRGLRWVRI